MKKLMKFLLKILACAALFYGSIFLGIKGFDMHNSSAADICFGAAMLLFIAGLNVWII